MHIENPIGFEVQTRQRHAHRGPHSSPLPVELESRSGHVYVIEKRPGRSTIYGLTHSENPTGLKSPPAVEIPHPHSGNPTGADSENPTLRKRNVDGSLIKKLRTYGHEEETEPSDEMILALVELGWPTEKVRRETPAIYRKICGRANEGALFAELARAKSRPDVREPFAYALAAVERSVTRSA